MSNLCSKCGIHPLKSKTRCEKCLQAQKNYNKLRRLNRIKSGLCATCGKIPPIDEFVSCKVCLDYQRRKYCHYRENGKCSYCVKNIADVGKLCSDCLKIIKQKRDEARNVTYAAYGGCCKCCSEKEEVFLSIDHVNNDGAEKRRSKSHPRGGADLCKWLIKHNFPKEFQLLCHNCQWGKRVFGTCPHNNGD